MVGVKGNRLKEQWDVDTWQWWAQVDVQGKEILEIFDFSVFSMDWDLGPTTLCVVYHCFGFSTGGKFCDRLELLCGSY